ncbi:hypothetical protein COCCU_12090 [Corynebacterium occultum]|uniref:DUF6779 domain-containing protein n=1 Tax=Corynebacterium occultum TaxID=2675219 RepID=A0A6B8WPR6_9CORY|nr:DUF6779 domain-containing protein [Corynebacterium occultum]QGU08318.1 hypothetical protein COCCU_12090 [Corynebacterium occultum]
MSVEKSEKSSTGAIDRGQMLLIALVVLALIASVIMLVTDSNTALKFALIAALWAAVIGFFLVTRYRREAQRSEEQLQHERKLHEVESDKERAEQQAEQEKFAREYQEKQRAEDADTLTEIQQELAELRANLEALSGQDFGYEPAALRAQARRIMELESESGAGLPRGPHVKGAPSSAAVTGLLGQTPKEPMRRPEAEGPTTAETEIVRTPEEIASHKTVAEKSSPEKDTAVKAAAEKHPTPKPTAAQPATPKIPAEKTATTDDARAAVKSAEPQVAETPKVPTPSTSETRVFNSGSFGAVKWDAVGDKHVADDEAKSPVVGAHSAARKDAEKAATQAETTKAGHAKPDLPKDAAAETTKAGGAPEKAAAGRAEKPGAPERPEAEKPGVKKPGAEQSAEEKAAEERRGRRRRDERSDGVSVADLLANIKKEGN